MTRVTNFGKTTGKVKVTTDGMPHNSVTRPTQVIIIIIIIIIMLIMLRAVGVRYSTPASQHKGQAERKREVQ